MEDSVKDIKIATKYKSLHDSAKRRKKEFSLTLNSVRKLLTRKRCAYTGVVLTEPSPVPAGSPAPKLLGTDRTIDRIDPDKGYHPDNVVAVCHLANSLKEALLESKRNDGPHPLACDLKFLSNFLKGITKAGYSE